MTYFIFARDGTSQIVLKRDSEDRGPEEGQRTQGNGLVRR
jgi:hypothetical protein